VVDGPELGGVGGGGGTGGSGTGGGGGHLPPIPNVQGSGTRPGYHIQIMTPSG
jgi:hypothetical protein